MAQGKHASKNSVEQARDEQQREFDQRIKVERQLGTLTFVKQAALTAGHAARVGAIEDGLLGTVDAEGKLHFTVQQGLKAACFAREDAAAGFTIQLVTLAQVRLNQRLLWAALALLAYIAFRVT